MTLHCCRLLLPCACAHLRACTIVHAALVAAACLPTCLPTCLPARFHAQIAGNSVHVDLAFMRKHMPRLVDHLSYR